MARESGPAPDGSINALSSIAPDDLGDADQRQDRAVNRPMIIADHEADAEGQVEALENPDSPHADHRKADQGADNPHCCIECFPHGVLSYQLGRSTPRKPQTGWNSIRLWRTGT